jgi:transketolase
MNPTGIEGLDAVARTIRTNIVKMMSEIGYGHVGGSLSIVEILVCLYHRQMRLRAGDPKWPERDRFVLSKGHCGPALYAVLESKGYLKYEDLMTLNKNGTILPSHCDMIKTPGVDMSAGSLGMGLSAAVGMALAAKKDGSDMRVYFVIGDGESQEGQIWEAAMAAHKFELDNLIGFVDSNKLQIDGRVSEIIPIDPINDKWAAFGWHVQEIDGHNCQQILCALDRAASWKGQPSIIIANTIKGKGVSFFENQVACHHVCFEPGQVESALKELEVAA